MRKTDLALAARAEKLAASRLQNSEIVAQALIRRGRIKLTELMHETLIPRAKLLGVLADMLAAGTASVVKERGTHIYAIADEPPPEELPRDTARIKVEQIGHNHRRIVFGDAWTHGRGVRVTPRGLSGGSSLERVG